MCIVQSIINCFFIESILRHPLPRTGLVIPMASIQDLKETAARLSRRGHGILAADESVNTIGKRLKAKGLENNSETRRKLREVLITAPGIEHALSGVILFEETLYQKASDGRRFVDILNSVGILPGIKVDKGLQKREGSPRETVTMGLDGLRERCKKYFDDGARFAKWRATIRIDVACGLPTDTAIDENAETLAKYALEAQRGCLVPIVEPEILIDGIYDIQTSADVARRVIRACYRALKREEVVEEASLLKPMMVLPGLDCPERESIGSELIARTTLDVMRDVVPASVPGIMFLSGGMSEVEATRNLNELNKLAADEGAPWSLSFSFGRALQSSALTLWSGKEEMVEKAKKMAAAVALANGRAQLGAFDGRHPSIDSENRSLHESFRGWGGAGNDDGGGVRKQ